MTPGRGVLGSTKSFAPAAAVPLKDSTGTSGTDAGGAAQSHWRRCRAIPSGFESESGASDSLTSLPLQLQQQHAGGACSTGAEQQVDGISTEGAGAEQQPEQSPPDPAGPPTPVTAARTAAGCRKNCSTTRSVTTRVRADRGERVDITPTRTADRGPWWWQIAKKDLQHS